MLPRRILVTGAGGFVGRHLLPALAAAFPDAELHPSRADLLDPAALDAEVAALRPDACVHLAAVSAIRQASADPDRAWRVNLHGTLHLAESVLAEAPSCRFLHVSSADAYGLSFRAGAPLDEGAPLAPADTYGATKAAADLAIGALALRGLAAIRFRPFNHTGPGQSEEFAVPAFAAQLGG